MRREVEVRSKSAPDAQEKEVARLARERDEALEQQTATSEVLRIISASSPRTSSFDELHSSCAARVHKYTSPADDLNFASKINASKTATQIVPSDQCIAGISSYSATGFATGGCAGVSKRAGTPMECPVCFDTSARDVDSAGDVVELECKRCGPFRYGARAWEKLKKAPENNRAVIASWLWDQNRFGSVPTIDESNVDALLSMQPLPFLEKAKRLLIHFAEQTDRLGKPLLLSSPRLDAMVGTLVHNDLVHINQFLLDRGWIEDVVGGYWKVTGGGLIQADEWRASSVSSTQAFVAMWFNSDLDIAWKDGFQKGISGAGYKPMRIDTKEHANKICDEIIAEIRRSRFLVADYTGHRGGVYYEAGYAAGRDLPVILTCRKNDMANLHFDIRQYNCIDWETPKELAHRLQVRIEAVIGDGPLKRK